MFIGEWFVHFLPASAMKKAFATLQRANAGICSHQRNAAQGLGRFENSVLRRLHILKQRPNFLHIPTLKNPNPCCLGLKCNLQHDSSWASVKIITVCIVLTATTFN